MSPPAAWATRLHRWVRPRLATLLDRLADRAERHTTPRQALTVLAAVGAAVAVVLALIAGPSAALSGGQLTASRSLTEPTTPPAGEPFDREVPRPMAAAPQTSPAAPEPPEASPPDGDFVGWAILDRRNGQITGSDTLARTSTTASMIKAWLVADYLRLTHEAGETPSEERLDVLSVIIRDSRNTPTQRLFDELGEHASIERLIAICGLTDSYAIPHWWSNTQLSARDTARMGACLADGRAAGAQWTGWLLDEMRLVRGAGDFGIRHAFPPAQRSSIAIKNGWVIRDDEGEWHVNCLAVGDTWTMGVMLRYPTERGYEHGTEVCRSLAEQHLLPAVSPG